MNLEHIDSFSLEATFSFEKLTIKGTAKVSFKSRTCEFYSDFVPLLPLNSPVTILTRYQGVKAFIIYGPTFVSSKRFIRVQPINITLCEGAEEVIEVPVKIPITCTKKRFFTTTYEQCEIVSCSPNKLIVSGAKLSPEKNDNELKITVGAPIFANRIQLSLTFDDGGMLFGKNSRKAKYRYNITDIDASSRHILLRYIRKSALKEITRQMTSNAVDYNKKNIFK